MDCEGYRGIDNETVTGCDETLNFSCSGVIENDLMEKEHITPEDILGLTSYTKNFLCLPSANVYGLEFVRFALRDYETGAILVDLKSNGVEKDTKEIVLEDNETEGNATLQSSAKDFVTGEKTLFECELPEVNYSQDETQDGENVRADHILGGEIGQESFQPNKNQEKQMIFEDLGSTKGLGEFDERHIQYDLPPEVLYSNTIGAIVEFKVGDKEIKNLRMIELHFFKDKLLKKFEFEFGFCIPNSLNSWEHIYQIPELSPEMVQEIIGSPYETRSETFYFANGTLIIHNKAAYSYNEVYKGDWD